MQRASRDSTGRSISARLVWWWSVIDNQACMINFYHINTSSSQTPLECTVDCGPCIWVDRHQNGDMMDCNCVKLPQRTTSQHIQSPHTATHSLRQCCRSCLFLICPLFPQMLTDVTYGTRVVWQSILMGSFTSQILNARHPTAKYTQLITRYSTSTRWRSRKTALSGHVWKALVLMLCMCVASRKL